MNGQSLIVGTFCLVISTQAAADAALVYELTDKDGKVTEQRLSIRNFFVRVDDSTIPNEYLLFQAGKFFPLYRVDTKARTYQRLTQNIKPTLKAGVETAEPVKKKPHPSFKPERKKDTVAGIPCRVVNELRDDKPVIRHCMANIGNLKITTREIRTLARWFAVAREKQLGWIGIGTKDEEFAAVRSEEIDGERSLLLKSVSRDPLPRDYLRVPRDFKEIPFEKKIEKEAKGATGDGGTTEKNEPKEGDVAAPSGVTPPLSQQEGG